MAIADRYGLALSTSSTTAAERYQDGMDRLLAYQVGAGEGFAASVAADEGFALGHAGVALHSFFLGDGRAAREAIARASERAGGITRREQRHVAALSAILGGDTARGLALVDEHVAESPRDALVVNQASSTIGFGGREDRERHRLEFLERLAPAYGEDWWFQSALGFVYHEVDRIEESRDLSERSLAQYPGNANASHNIAHCCFETVDNAGGAAFLEQWLADYDPKAPFHCHMAWHLALFELHQGRVERALEIYDRDILPAVNGRLAAIDGAALLWRVALYGDGAARRPWQPLGELAKRVARPGFVFGDVHAAFAYAAGGDAAALSALIESLKALDAKGHPIAGRVVLPLVEGIAAYVAGDWAGALARFEPLEAEVHRIGGSHAQWELFEETRAVCHLKLNQAEDAARLLGRRLARRASPQDLAWLAEASAR